jgi:hypothetical protein
MISKASLPLPRSQGRQMNGIKTFISNPCKTLLFPKNKEYHGITVVAIYVVCDEVLKMLEIKDNSQALMSTSEVALTY